MPEPTPAAPARRVALVIGIGAYESARKLEAPRGDATRMGQLLHGLDFQVLAALDSDFNELRKSLRNFYEHLRGADLGVLYFSGHGVQDEKKENYLLPTDADLHEPEDVTRTTFSLRRIMEDMNRRVGTGLIFLDACRDNPFEGEDAERTKSVLAGTGGLAAVPKKSLGGLLVAFASDEGNVAIDGTGDTPSPFTAALLRHLPTPGRSVTSALIDVRREVEEATKGRQMPWTQDSLKHEVVLAPLAAPVAPPKPPRMETTVLSGGAAPFVSNPLLTRAGNPPVIVHAPPIMAAATPPAPAQDPAPPAPAPKPTYPVDPPVTRKGGQGALIAVLALGLGLGGYGVYRVTLDPAQNPTPQPQPQPQETACAGLPWAKEMVCRVPDLASTDETTHQTTAKELEHALTDVSLAAADKAAIVTALLDMAEAPSMAQLSQDGRYNVLARLSAIPQDLWLDPALLEPLDRAHRIIAALEADTSGLLGNQTGAFLKTWITATGYWTRGNVTVHPHFAGFVRETEWDPLMKALASGWGWTLQKSERLPEADGKAEVRYGTDTMKPLALLMAAQLNGQVAPSWADDAQAPRIRKTVAVAKLRRITVAKARGIKDGRLEIWIGK